MSKTFKWEDIINQNTSINIGGVWDKDRWNQEYPIQYGIPTFSTNKATPPMGWVCPQCHRVYSPSTAMCWYCPQEVPSDNTDAENEVGDE